MCMRSIVFCRSGVQPISKAIEMNFSCKYHQSNFFFFFWGGGGLMLANKRVLIVVVVVVVVQYQTRG